jgi:hypothetical protein
MVLISRSFDHFAGCQRNRRRRQLVLRKITRFDSQLPYTRSYEITGKSKSALMISLVEGASLTVFSLDRHETVISVT